MSQTSSINLYLHTHWDREWYLPYETYRAQLVTVVQQIVAKLESGELPNFLLDGQICALQDVLEIDQSLAEPIRDLMRSNKLSAGPWYVLADQMLVSGESLVRNMKVGLDMTRQFGEPAMIGYCPDTFGHTADMPRILRGFGIDSAFVWRGVPALDGPAVFRWVSPDGSWVLTHLLALGYYQTAFHDGMSPPALLAHLRKFVRSDQYPTIIPVGADHMGAPPDFLKQLEDVVTELKTAGDQEARSSEAARTQGATSRAGATTDAAVASLDKLQISTNPITSYSQAWSEVTAGGAKDIFAIKGELRDNSAAPLHERGYLLQGVLSTRLYLKRENRIAEHRLIKIAEPLYTMLSLMSESAYPQAEMQYIWKLLLKNHPHDSICGCSIDEVHREMMQRFHKFNHALNALDGRCVEAICSDHKGPAPRLSMAGMPITVPEYEPDRVAVFNLSTEPVNCPVLVAWAEQPADQRQSRSNKVSTSEIQFISKERQPVIFSGTGREPDVRTVDVNQAWVWATDIPAMGMRSIPFMSGPGASDSNRAIPQVKVESREIDNGFYSLKVDEDGELSVTALTEHGDVTYRLKHTLRDVGDGGDTYNFDPLVNDEPIQAKVTQVQPWLRGPLVGSLQITYEIEIPVGLLEEGEGPAPEIRGLYRSHHKDHHIITTEISLRRGVPMVFFDTRWVNRSADHRLEIVFDTGEKVEQTQSENHFSVLTRTHGSDVKTKLPVDKAFEAPLDRYPCQRFFIANDQLFLNLGMPEYGVSGEEVSLTALRAVSRLSRPRLQSRGGGAGPAVGTPEANCLGMNLVSYGWAALSEFSQYDQLAEAYELAERFEGTAYAVPIKADALPPSISMFSLDNTDIRCMSMYRNGDKTFIRLLNVAPEACSSQLTVHMAHAQLHRSNLDEVLEEEVSGVGNSGARTYRIEFGENQLVTLCLS